jgi:hypothetical protein
VYGPMVWSQVGPARLVTSRSITMLAATAGVRRAPLIATSVVAGRLVRSPLEGSMLVSDSKASCRPRLHLYGT